jgi:predicted nucleic acid-binding protein
VFLLDSNIYIAAFNEPGFGASFRHFHRAQLPRIVLSAVVVHELLVGARTLDRQRDLERGLLEPFRARRRLHVPGLATWELAAEIDRRLETLANPKPHFFQKIAEHWSDGGEKPSALRLDQKAQSPENLEAETDRRLSPTACVDQQEVRVRFDGQGNRCGMAGDV